MKNDLSEWLFFALIAAVLGATHFFLAREQGLMNASGDAIGYWETAVLAQRGEGVWRPVTTATALPMTHWAPGFSWAAAGFSALFSLPLMRGFELFGLFCLLLNLAVFARLLRLTVADRGARMVLLALVGLSFGTFFLPLELCSEPFFMLFVLSGSLFLVKSERDGQLKWLFAAAFLFGASVTVRFAGAGLVLFFSIWVLATQQTKKAIIGSAIFCLAPVAFFWVRNLIFFEEASSRIMAFYGLTPRYLLQLGRTAASFLMPTFLFKKWMVFSTPALLFLAFQIWRSGFFGSFFATVKKDKTELALVLWPIVYAAFLTFSQCFFDPTTSAAPRIYWPLWPPVLLLFGRFFDKTGASERSRLASAAFLSLASSAIWATIFAVDFYRNGTGTSRAVLAQNGWAKTLVNDWSDRTVYSYFGAELRFLGVDSAYYLPRKQTPFRTQMPVEKAILKLADHVEKTDGLIALPKKPETFGMVSLQAQDILRLRKMRSDTLSDGTIFLTPIKKN